MHLIDKHGYPKNYFFALTKEGVDGRRSLLLESGHRHRRSSTSSTLKETMRKANSAEKAMSSGTAASSSLASRPEEDEDSASDEIPNEELSEDADMADLTRAVSSLQFVPHSVRFGRGKGKSGFSRR